MKNNSWKILLLLMLAFLAGCSRMGTQGYNYDSRYEYQSDKIYDQTHNYFENKMNQDDGDLGIMRGDNF